MAITHERKFDVILNIFDVDGTAIRQTPEQRLDDLGSQVLDDVVDAARRRCLAAFDR